MAKIRLYSPVGEEAPHAEGIVPLKDPRGSRVAFLFNGHVSVIPVLATPGGRAEARL